MKLSKCRQFRGGGVDRTILLLAVGLFLSSVLAGGAALGQADYYYTIGDGDWGNTGIWSSMMGGPVYVSPGIYDVDSASIGHDVTVSSYWLDLGALDVSKQLSISGTARIDIYATGYSGNFENTGTVNIGGNAEVNLMSSSGSIRNYGTMTINDNAKVFASMWGDNYGMMTIDGSATVTTGAIFNGDLMGGGVLTINDSDNGIDVAIMDNFGGTIVLNNSSLTMQDCINDYGGVLEMNNSSLTASFFQNREGGVDLNSSHILIKNDNMGYPVFINEEGDFKLANGSSLTVESGATAEFGPDSQFLISGRGNKIIADEFRGETDWLTGVATFKVVGTDLFTDQVSIDAKISFVDGATLNATKGILVFQNVDVTLTPQVYDNAMSAVFSGSVNVGNGNANTDFFFVNSDVKPAPPAGASAGTFYGNDMFFTDSTVYISVGSSDFDKIIASGKIEFLGDTNVVLFDYGDAADSFTMNFSGAGGIFQAANGISVGGDALDQTDATTDTVNNEIQISGTNGSVVLQSDDFTFTGVRFENGNIVFNVGGGDTPKPPTPGVSNNVQTLTGVITQMQLKGGNTLTDAVTAYAGASRERFVEAMNELDSVGLSLSEIFVQNAVEKFNRTNYDRLHAMLNRNNYGGSYRGQDCNPCDPCSVFGRNNGREIWFQGIADWTYQEKTDINGYSADTYGFALGIDSSASRNTVFGIGFGGSFTRAKMHEGLGNAKADSYLLSLYGSQKVDALTVSGTVGYAFSNLESNRFAPKLGGNAKGVRDAETVFTGVELARRFGNRNGYMTPFIAYDYVSYSEKAFKETGNLINMNVAKKNVTGHLQTLGVRFGREIGAFKPELTAGWLHDYGVGTVRTAGAFVVDNNVPFIVDGVSRHKDRALLGVKANLALSSQSNLFFRYDGEWAKDYNTQYLSAGLCFGF